MINMDFSQAVTINTAEQDWVASPKAGVWRKPLAREEAERGHATSIVKSLLVIVDLTWKMPCSKYTPLARKRASLRRQYP